MTAQLVLMIAGLALVWACGAANREDTRPGFFGLAQWLLLVVLASAATSSLLHGDPIGAPVLAATVILAFPWFVARRWLIPRGHWRASWWLVRSSMWTWHDDNRGGALVAAAWAAIHAGAPPRALRFVEARCERSDCGAAHLLATGLVAAARGDLEGARRWMTSLCEFEGPATPRMARRLAVQWIAAEATTRGAWSRVAALADDRDADAATILLATVARRLGGTGPRPSDAELERAWSRAPSRQRLRALVDRALHHSEPVDAADPPHATPLEADPHRCALLAHAALVASPSPTARGLADACAAWDRVLGDAGFVDTARRRAAVLGARVDPPEALSAGIQADLVTLVRATGLELGEGARGDGETLVRVRRALHQRLLDELEIVADALASRVRARRILAMHEEWREYLAVRGAFARAVAMTGPELQRLGYAIVNPPVCALAVWLWNDRRNRVHAHQMFRWLLREAELAEDTEAIALHRRNVECG